LNTVPPPKNPSSAYGRAARVFAKMTVPEMTLTSNHELDYAI